MRKRSFLVRTLLMLSLLMTAALVALWMHSKFVAMGVRRVDTGIAADGRAGAMVHQYAVGSNSGFVCFAHVRAELLGEYPSTRVQYSTSTEAAESTRLEGKAPSLLKHLGIDWRFANRSQGSVATGDRYIYSETFIEVGYRLLVPCSVLLCIALWFWSRRIACRAISGHCVGCGYDLRASVTQCPECGLAIANE